MPKGILGLEVSSGVIRYVYLQKKARKLTISRCGATAFTNSLSGIKSPPALSEAIKKIILEERVVPAKQCLALSGPDTLIHQINLPKMSDSELKEVISGEIERVSVFSHKDFDYIYSEHKLDAERSSVLFTAITKENLDFYLQGASGSGVGLESLEISPLNLWEILSSQVEKTGHEALLVLEEKVSYLLIFSQNECRFFYAMSTGGQDLCPRKNEPVSNSVFFVWIEEVKRLFKSYVREYKAKEIGRLWFVWDNQAIPGLDKLLADELRIKIDLPTPDILGIEMADKEKEFNPIYLVALAAPLVYLKGLRHKLFFEHFLEGVKLKKAAKKTLVLSLALVFLLGASLGAVALSYFKKRNDLLKEDKKISSDISILRDQTFGLAKEARDYLTAKERLLSQATAVKTLNRISWSEVFARVEAMIPQDVSFTSFIVLDSGEVKIKGSSLKIDSLAELIRKINATPGFEEAKFESLRETEIEGKKIVEFGIYTRLKKSAIPDTEPKQDEKK